MLSRLARLALLLFPLAGAAQTLPSLVPTSSTPLVEQLLALDASGQPLPGQGAPVLPIWSGSSGKLLAVVALPRDWPRSLTDATPGYEGPSAWHLTGTLGSAGGLRWQADNGLHADAMFGQYLASAPLACVAGGCDAGGPQFQSGSLTGSFGLGWSTADGNLDLSYGLSWLQSQGGEAGVGRLAPGSALMPMLPLPNTQGYALDGETAMYARGSWRFEHDSALNVAARFGRGKLSALDGLANPASPGIDLDQLSLSLGLDVGSLRGAIVGHVLSSDDPLLAGKRWTTLDLGVSWRTPWSGELSVGAQNLWSAPSNSPRDAENQTRTPYIQYRQDL